MARYLSLLLLALACSGSVAAARPGEYPRLGSVSPAVAQRIKLVSPSNDSTIDTPLTATLKWTPITGASCYRLGIRNAGPKKSKVETGKSTDDHYRLALRPETTYTWTVEALDARGNRIAAGGPFTFSTSLPAPKEIIDTKLLFAGARPGAHWVYMDPVPEDASEPVSPWYSKKSYDQSPPPSFEQVKDRLPKPVWEGHQDAIDMYWYAWNTLFSIWLYPPPKHDHIAVSNLIGMPTWAGWGSTMVWDTAFILQFARYGNNAYPFVTSLDNCYARQHENGFICRESDNKNFETYCASPVNLPLLAWAEWSYYQVSGDVSRLRKVFLPLVKQYEWYMLYQRRSDGLYWGTCMGDGMDDSPRGPLAHSYLSTTSVMALSAETLAKMARLVGRADMAGWFTKESGKLKIIVNARFWDEDNQLYNDLAADGRPITKTKQGGTCKHVFVFWPMLAGTSTPERAACLAKHLEDASSFNRPCGTASLSADSDGYNKDTGQYWRGSVWPPTQYMVIRGLDRCGNERLASSIAEKYYASFLAAFKAAGDISESIAPEQPKMHGCGKFVGWGGLAPIAILFEDILGIRVDALSNKVEWYLRRLERHGIENLRFGNRIVSLVCEERGNASDPYKIAVDSSGDFQLIIHSGENTITKRIHKGHSIISP